MKVLYVTTGCFDKGGISRYCRYQISALRELFGSKNVDVFSLLGPDGKGFEVPFDVSWHGGTGGLPDKVTMSARAVAAAVAKRPDVVHLAHVNLAPLGMQLGRLSGAQTLLNIYGLEVWSGLSARRRNGMRAMSHIMADCHFTADFALNAGLSERLPSVIWDCVDLERFTPGPADPAVLAKYGLPDKAASFVVMSLGRLARGAAHKGYDRLIEVFSFVRKECNNTHLVIAGDGDDRVRLEELVEKFGLCGHVTFPGPVDEGDLADVYRSASVFSLVSDRGPGRGEGVPLTPLEAMSCGIPILVGNQDGSKEAIIAGADGGLNGRCLDPFDLAGHAQAIVELAGSSDLHNRLAEGARRIAFEKFGYARFVDEHNSLYRRLALATSLAPRCVSDGHAD